MNGEASSKDDFNIDPKLFVKVIRDEFLKFKMEMEESKGSKASGSDEESHESRSSSSKGKRRYAKYNDESDPKIKYSTFKGNSNPDSYLYWEMKFKQIFRMSDWLEEKKVKLASFQIF